MRTIALLLMLSAALHAQKLSELSTLDTTPASGDKFFILDADDATSLKGITYSNLMGGNAATATALAANPADCSAGLFATTIAANGALTCGAVAYADVTGTPTLRYQTVDDEDTPLTQRGTINFEGAGVSCADDTDQTTCTISGGGGGFDPHDRSVAWWRDDFMTYVEPGSARAGELGWFQSTNGGGAYTAPAAEDEHPGLHGMNSTTTDNSYLRWYLTHSQNDEQIADLDGATFDSHWIVKLSSCAEVALNLGFAEAGGITPSPTTGIYVRVDTDDTDTNFIFLVGDGTEQANDTTIPCDTAWHDFRIYSTVAGTVNLDIDGVNRATEATNVPTVALVPFMQIASRNVTAKLLTVDFFSMSLGTNR